MNIGKKIRYCTSILTVVISALVVVLLAYQVSAALPYFNPVPPAEINCTQGAECFYDFNATDPEGDQINYSIDTPPFSENIDANTGILNFTPINSQVRNYDIPTPWVIVKETATGLGTQAYVKFFILNVNDPPNITSQYPLIVNLTTKENAPLDFNITADDPDLHIDVGERLNYTWYLDGLENLTLLNYTNNTANYTPDFLSAGMHNISVIVMDLNGSTANTSWLVNVTNENRNPVLNSTIPNITLAEDTSLPEALNLSDYFYDNDTDDTLFFSHIDVFGDNLTIDFNQTWPNTVGITPYPNFFGINIIQFRVFDGYNATFSNNVTINVTPVNDPPNVTQLENQTIYVGTLKPFRVQAYDPDYDPLTYYCNLSFINMSSTTGESRFVPTLAHIGNYTVAVNVSDNTTNVSMIFNLSIINNSAPAITDAPLPDRIAVEDNTLVIIINATDVDPGDTIDINYSTDKSSSHFAMNQGSHDRLTAQAQLTFTPDQSDVDNTPYTVTIYATDNKGAISSDSFLITVINTEHPPQLIPNPVPPQRMKINRTFNLTISGSDADQNIGIFSVNTTIFNITTTGGGNSAQGLINFTPNDSMLGEHWVNISINDSTGRVAWNVTLFNITNNTAPFLPQMPNQTTIEDLPFLLFLNATDIDPQDTLTYYHNGTINDTPIFNISPSGWITFTPVQNQTGNHSINITVSDGEANTSVIMNLTIEVINDIPIWTPNLSAYYVNESIYLNTTHWNSTNILSNATNMTVWNSSLLEKSNITVQMKAFDEEMGLGLPFPYILEFTYNILNFTNASNDTVYSGINLFSLTNLPGRGDIALMEMSPNNSQVGSYYVNLSVYDFNNRTSEIIKMIIYNVNDNPEILSYNPIPLFYQNMYENQTMSFSILASDADYGDSLRYNWALDFVNLSGQNTTSFDYYANFTSAGWRNITAYAIDTSNASTSVNWVVNVTNVNRLGWYGEIRQGIAEFPTGKLENMTVGVNGIQLNDTGAGYESAGLYESKVLDTKEPNYMHKFTTINWTGDLNNSAFNVYLQTRTHPGSSSGCPSTISTPYNESVFYIVQNAGIITLENERCIQYRIVMSTANTSVTPIIKTVTLGYAIADRQQEQNTNQSWVDLDNYFFDLDTDDIITFNVTSPNSSEINGVNITILNGTNRVYVATSGSFVGTTQVVFHAWDGYNMTDSNIININVTEPVVNPMVIIVPVAGGGGSTSVPVPYQVTKYVVTPVSFRLITPNLVTTYSNNTIEVPINIFNSNFTMNNLKLKASSPNENVKLTLSRDTFPVLRPNEKQFITLYADSYKTYGAYEILIEATADATSVAEDGKESTTQFTEKAKIFINSLLKAEGNESQANTKFAFAEDLLSTNPECLELNEFIEKARALISQGKTGEADIMLERIVSSCKYLVTKKTQKVVELPKKVYGMPEQSAAVLLAVSITTLIVAISLVAGWSRIRNKGK